MSRFKQKGTNAINDSIYVAEMICSNRYFFFHIFEICGIYRKFNDIFMIRRFGDRI